MEEENKVMVELTTSSIFYYMTINNDIYIIDACLFIHLQ